jgi:urease subunit alpha
LTQPRAVRPYFGGLGAAPRRLSRVFVSERCLADRAARRSLPDGVRYAAIRASRGLTSADMVANSATPEVAVPTDPGPVLVDGRPVPVHHAADLPLTRLHHLA